MTTIEARDGVSTGISAADRARTIAAAVDPHSTPEDLVKPGHVFPLRAPPGGVMERAGRIETAIDFTVAAGMSGAAILCQVLRDDGQTAADPELRTFAKLHGLAIVAVSDMVQSAAPLSLKLLPRSPTLAA